MSHSNDGSLANYYLASKQVERYNDKLIAELRDIIRLLMEEIDGEIPAIDQGLYDRVKAVLEDQE